MSGCHRLAIAHPGADDMEAILCRHVGFAGAAAKRKTIRFNREKTFAQEPKSLRCL